MSQLKHGMETPSHSLSDLRITTPAIGVGRGAALRPAELPRLLSQ